MSSRLEIVEQNIMTPGMIKQIMDEDSVMQYMEMLISEITRLRVVYDKENNMVNMEFSDKNLDLTELNASLGKKTLKVLIKNLKTLYNQLEETE